MQLPDVQRNIATEEMRIQPDGGVGVGVLKLYDDNVKTTLGVTINLNDPAYTASNVQGNAGAGLQPQTQGKAWLDVSTTAVIGTPVSNIIAAYAEIEDSNGVVCQKGNVGAPASGDFVEINATQLSTLVDVQVLNGFLETLAGSL